MSAMKRRSSSQTKSSPGGDVSLHIILAVRKHQQQAEYLGPLEEAPQEAMRGAGRYRKEFPISAHEARSIDAGNMDMCDSIAFEQANAWLRDGDKEQASSAKTSPAPTSTPAGEQERYVSRMIEYNTTLSKRNKKRADDIYLVWDFGSNRSPPKKGQPQIFRSWEASLGMHEEEAVEHHTKGHSRCLFKKFGNANGTSAAEWLRDFSTHDVSYTTRWGACAPVWFCRPVDYTSNEHQLWERKGREPLNRGPPPPLPPNQLHLRQKAQRRALARPPLGQANPK